MAARKVNYCYVTVPNRAGKGAEVLREIKAAKVNLLAYSGFPASGGNSQLDMVASSITPIKRVAQQNGWKISKAKKGFLIQGPDKAGAVYRNIQKLADRGINVTAADAVAAGKGRYGMLIWVKPKDYTRAARALKAK
jgi:hypothetical protein